MLKLYYENKTIIFAKIFTGWFNILDYVIYFRLNKHVAQDVFKLQAKIKDKLIDKT